MEDKEQNRKLRVLSYQTLNTKEKKCRALARARYRGRQPLQREGPGILGAREGVGGGGSL